MSDDPRVDAIWESLAPHIEWARGFSLILLFAHHPAPVEQIRTRLEASLREHHLGLQVIEPRDYEDAEALTLAVLAKPAPDCGAIWLPLWWGDDDRSRRLLLGWLNERRFLLERDVARPLVLVLPSDYRSKIANAAPDLWVVRNFSQQLPSPEIEFVPLSERASETHEVFVNQPPGPAELEWRRLTSASDQRGLALADGLLAFESARERGRLWDARRIAMEMLMVVMRGRVDGDALVVDRDELLVSAESLDSRLQRNLAVVLDCLAEVETEAGNLTGARELYQRSLDARETLVKADPDDAHDQRHLSVSYDKMGNVEAQAGNLASARYLYRRALKVSEALVKADPDNAEEQRDLSVSYLKLGDVESETGNLAGAGDLYRRALKVSEALAKANPDDARVQRDLSVSYDKLGGVEAQEGNLVVARDLYRRALEVSETLAKANPHNIQAQRDLSISVERMGTVEEMAGNLPVARELYRRSLEMSEELAKAHSHSALAQFDVVLSFFRLARVAEKAGDIDEHRGYLQRANAILDDLDATGMLHGYAQSVSIRQSVQTKLAALKAPDDTSA